MHRLVLRLKALLCVLLAVGLLAAPSTFAGHATESADVKVTDDNNNVDGGNALTTPSKDARNRQSN